jgi:hypothetical protein
MLDIFKSGLVKRTMRNGSIRRDSRGGVRGQVMVNFWVGRQSLVARGFLLLANKRRVGQVQPSGALGKNALIVGVTK